MDYEFMVIIQNKYSVLELFKGKINFVKSVKYINSVKCILHLLIYTQHNYMNEYTKNSYQLNIERKKQS